MFSQLLPGKNEVFFPWIAKLRAKLTAKGGSVVLQGLGGNRRESTRGIPLKMCVIERVSDISSGVRGGITVKVAGSSKYGPVEGAGIRSRGL